MLGNPNHLNKEAVKQAREEADTFIASSLLNQKTDRRLRNMLLDFHSGEDYPCPVGCPGNCVLNCVRETFELRIDDDGKYHPGEERYVRNGKPYCCGKELTDVECKTCGTIH